MKTVRLEFGADWIEVDLGTPFNESMVQVGNVSGAIRSNLKEGCAIDPAECIGCAAIDGIESLILGHACAGIDISTDQYKQGVEAALDAIGNLD